jgi:uncharacterized protein DUF5781
MAQALEPVKDSFRKALGMMEKAGYPIKAKVKVVVDPKLPFMGYTVPRGDGFTIVVSGAAVHSGMVEGLLVHEMGHVYRMSTGHPSHSAAIIDGVVSPYARGGRNTDYQQKILHDIVNHLEDLYADDISFRAFKGTDVFNMDVGSEFFQSWLTPEPANTGDVQRDRWLNASIMLRNSFALSNMARHGIPDAGSKARDMNRKFLSRMGPGASEQFEYFYDLMLNLDEKVKEKEYRKLLTEYVGTFVELAEGPAK